MGLITIDEVIYAGGFSGNSGYYLYTGNSYWTMSPSNYSGGISLVSHVDSNGATGSVMVNVSEGVRPVINIGTNVTITGEGTIVSPYIVS